MEFSKEETNPLMFGYWGNKSFQEWLCYIYHSFYFDSKKTKYDIFYLLYFDMSFGVPRLWVFVSYYAQYLYKEATLSSTWMNIQVHQNNKIETSSNNIVIMR